MIGNFNKALLPGHDHKIVILVGPTKLLVCYEIISIHTLTLGIVIPPFAGAGRRLAYGASGGWQRV